MQIKKDDLDKQINEKVVVARKKREDYEPAGGLAHCATQWRRKAALGRTEENVPSPSVEDPYLGAGWAADAYPVQSME